MRSYPSSSCSNSSSSSSYARASTSLSHRLETIFKKADELSILCEIEICVIHYGPDGELKTWPEDREKVKDMALRYSQLDEAVRRKKRFDLYGFLNKKKNKTNFKKKAKTKDNDSKKRKTSLKNVNDLKYPISDHYSPDQISQLIQSLELNVSKFQERLRFVESQKQKETKLNHQSSTPISLNHHQQQSQSLNPSQFSLFMYNHGDATLSQIPLSASNFNQDFSALLQQSGLKNQLMKQELCGYDKNMCMSDITNNNFQLPCVSSIQDYPVAQESGMKNQLMQKELYGCDQNMWMGNINSNNFQHPCVSNTEHYSAVQESVNNSGLNQLMQHELYGYDQSMCTNSNILDPCLSNTVSDEFCSNYQDPCGNMVGNTSFSQDMSSSYVINFDESSLVETSTLPSLSTIPNSYFLSNNSVIL